MLILNKMIFVYHNRVSDHMLMLTLASIMRLTFMLITILELELIHMTPSAPYLWKTVCIILKIIIATLIRDDRKSQDG